jgi:hypothetical protein
MVVDGLVVLYDVVPSTKSLSRNEAYVPSTRNTAIAKDWKHLAIATAGNNVRFSLR